MRPIFAVALLSAVLSGCFAAVAAGTSTGTRVFIPADARATPCVQAADANRKACESACEAGGLLQRHGCNEHCANHFDAAAVECPGVRVLRG